MTAQVLTNANVTALAKTLTDLPLGAASNCNASEKRLGKLLAARIGEDRAADALIAILAQPDLAAANAMLAAAIAEVDADQDHAAAEEGDDTSLVFTARPYIAPAEAPAAAAKKPRKTAAAKEPKAATPGKAATIEAAAKAGILPDAPDFSAPTHKAFLKKHAALVAAAEASDLAALQAFEIKPSSSSPKALIRYRDRAIIALQARAEVAA